MCYFLLAKNDTRRLYMSSVIRILLAILSTYLLMSIIIAIYDVCMTFKNVIDLERTGQPYTEDDLPKVFGVENYIFVLSILFYNWIFIIIDKVVAKLKG